MKIEHTYIVYIVECKDWSYFIGITNDLEKRLWEHNTVQDMWNRQRQAKSASDMMRRWNLN